MGVEQRLVKGLEMIDAHCDYLLGGKTRYQRWLLFELSRHFSRLLREHYGTKVRATVKVYDIPGIRGG